MRSPKKLAAANVQADAEAQFKTDLIGLIPYLRAFSFTLCGHRALAEDIAQEALAKSWKARRSFQAGTNLKAWLFTILRNEYTSHQRRAWRQVPWDVDAGAMIRVPPDEQSWASELSDVGRALIRVPAAFREALILVSVAGFSYQEAASIAKAQVGTMKSRVSRGRATLIELLEKNKALPKRRPSSEESDTDQFLAQIPLAARANDAAPGNGRLLRAKRNRHKLTIAAPVLSPTNAILQEES